MKDEIKEILEYLNEFVNDKEEITKYGCEISVKQAKQLLDYITNLEQEKNMFERSFKTMSKNYFEVKSRIDKAIENIDLTIEIIKQQPTEDDSWILNRLNGFKYILKGSEKR